MCTIIDLARARCFSTANVDFVLECELRVPDLLTLRNLQSLAEYVLMPHHQPWIDLTWVRLFCKFFDLYRLHHRYVSQ